MIAVRCSQLCPVYSDLYKGWLCLGKVTLFQGAALAKPLRWFCLESLLYRQLMCRGEF